MTSTDLVERVWTALKQRVCSDPSNAKRCVMVSYDDLAATLRSQADERGKVVALLRALRFKYDEHDHQSSWGPGGHWASSEAIEAIERGDHERTDPSPDHTDPSRDAGEMTLERAIDKTVASIKAAFAPTPPEPSVHSDTPMDGGWLPIETAPKDGPFLALCLDEGEIESVELMTGPHLFESGDLRFFNINSGNYSDMRRWSHWMPLPPAPTDHSHPENSHDR